MKLMIVDDNPKIRKLIKQEICEEEDYVIECADGEEVLTKYEDYLPDFVLMDVKMEKINGITATKMIKEKFPEAKIIIITDFNSSSFRSAAKTAGAIAFVLKENLCEVKNYLKPPSLKK